jgi:hypothetical protein
LLEERDLSVTVENGNGDPPAVPADKAKINHLGRDTPAVEILADPVGKILMELPGKLHEIAVLVGHAARVAAG